MSFHQIYILTLDTHFLRFNIRGTNNAIKTPTATAATIVQFILPAIAVQPDDLLGIPQTAANAGLSSNRIIEDAIKIAIDNIQNLACLVIMLIFIPLYL